MSKKITTLPKGRKCKHFGCKHILSIYNTETFCNTHSGDSPTKKRPQAAKSVAI